MDAHAHWCLLCSHISSIFTWAISNDFYNIKICLGLKYMSRLMSKATIWPVHPAKTQISLGIRPVWSVFVVRSVGSWGPKFFFMWTAKTLIRLGGCPGWCESLLGAHTILLVLSWGGSYIDNGVLYSSLLVMWILIWFCIMIARVIVRDLNPCILHFVPNPIHGEIYSWFFVYIQPKYCFIWNHCIAL